MSVQPGTYSAKITHYAMGETDKGTAYVQVTFQYEDGSANLQEIKWWGYLTEKSIPWTLKALVTMGFSGSDPLDLADASKGNLLTTEEVDIVIEHETYEGKTRAKVVAIYAPRPKFTLSQAKLKLGAMNLKAQMAAIRAEMGVKAPTPTKKAVGVDTSDEPLPF